MRLGDCRCVTYTESHVHDGLVQIQSQYQRVDHYALITILCCMVQDLRAVSVEVSSAVAKAACDQGNCDMTDIPTDIRAAVLQHMWQPTPGKKAGVEGQAVATVCGTEPDATAGNLAGEADAQDQASADGGGNYGRGNGGGDNGGWGNGEDGLKHATAGGNGSGTNGASAGASDKARGGVGDNFPAGIADDDEGVAELLKGNYVV